MGCTDNKFLYNTKIIHIYRDYTTKFMIERKKSQHLNKYVL